MPKAPDPHFIAQARAALAAADPGLAHAHARTPPFEWRTRPGGFEGLFQMIVEQQVSVASAAAIWGRVEAGMGAMTPEALLAHEPETLRGWGLSGQKARYGREIAQAQIEGRLDFAGLRHLADDDAIAVLTAIPGVGRWTAEIYLMFCEGRTDLFPAADIALQEAMRWADGAEVRPDARAARIRAERWAPHRSTAAHLLWGWYGGVKRGEIVLDTSA